MNIQICYNTQGRNYSSSGLLKAFEDIYGKVKINIDTINKDEKNKLIQKYKKI